MISRTSTFRPSNPGPARIGAPTGVRPATNTSASRDRVELSPEARGEVGVSAGVRALQAGDQERGRELLREAAGLPAREEVSVSAGVRALQAGNQERGRELLREAAGLPPQEEISVTAGIRALQAGDRERGLRILRLAAGLPATE